MDGVKFGEARGEFARVKLGGFRQCWGEIGQSSEKFGWSEGELYEIRGIQILGEFGLSCGEFGSGLNFSI